MRYIGSKQRLLTHIETIIENNVHDNNHIFCDLFSGTGSVGAYFKKNYQIISNDNLYFSYVLQQAYIVNTKPNNIEKLLNHFNTLLINTDYNWVTNNYSLANSTRMFFTTPNAQRIDTIRQTLNVSLTNATITQTEYFYLLASLLEATSRIANITGTYSAYLKYWENRTQKSLELMPLTIQPHFFNNEAYQQNSLELIKDIKGDILYLDPPYNGRQYSDNYHLLETIAKYDKPIITGMAGKRDTSYQKSKFCQKAHATDSLKYLIEHANFKHIILSYSSDGIIEKTAIENILKEYSNNNQVVCQEIDFRKYKSAISNNKPVLEYLFYIRKNYA